ncbi:T6SS effector phospholipase Tle3 domain-containing protein [Collimonas humicola]|uniref:T6SS effector phospholipase Tle3 domain-containing protein n=1 Tax=Collimonas humicola TaxID=2825886 RepID=UPI001B8D4681|nr:DUF3274 domain-containing protein [Collimonas humicola]
MADELSTLPLRLRPHAGISQWVECRYSYSDINPQTGNGTDHVAVPDLMPGTIIFVHGVNSEGEWYEAAAKQFADGLQKRLGRKDLEALEPLREDEGDKHRFRHTRKDGSLYRSPIIPFYWGYKLQDGDLEKYPGIYHGDDMAWGGGPFQNGTNNINRFWGDGFKKKLLGGLSDLDKMNPELGRQLEDAPPRSYMIHAARRLANLIDQIREDCPNEPINIVAHSQGNMITLCAMLFLKESTRAPDTLLLNNAPYAFDTKITDWLTKDSNLSGPSENARKETFANIAKRIAKAKDGYPATETTAQECMRYAPKDLRTVHMQYDPNDTEEQRNISIGSGVVNDKGQRWYEDVLYSRADFDHNRGKIFVNFNPNDRVIGVSAVEGIGWRGIAEKYLSETNSTFPNVYQRLFVRNSDGKTVADPVKGTSDAGITHIPPVGQKKNYWQPFFITVDKVRQNISTSDENTILTTGEGEPVATENSQLRTHDGYTPFAFWRAAPNNAHGLPVPVQGTPGTYERVWINAPVVPEPAMLGDKFNSSMVPLNGVGVDDGGEQMEDYRIYKKFYVPNQQITVRGPDGQIISRTETYDEACKRIDATEGPVLISPTDHSRFLRYGSDELGKTSHPVAQVLAYDLCVGSGYAFGDHEYWKYLLDLADWKRSDPCYVNGAPYPAPGPMPTGLVTD